MTLSVATRPGLAGLVAGLLLVPASAGAVTGHSETTQARARAAQVVPRPPMPELAAAVVRREVAPARLVFLGSSTTYGAGAGEPHLRYVDRVNARLQVLHPVPGTMAPVRPVAAGTRQRDRGLQAFNGAAPGTTSQTYVPPEVLAGIDHLHPACVVHMIGSNDSVFGVPVSAYEKAVEATIARIDRVLADGPRACHLLVHTFRRHGVSPATWGEYGQALARSAARHRNVSMLDLSDEFEQRQAAGGGLLAADGVHPSAAGHALIADLVLDVLVDGIGTRRERSRLDTDRDGLTDRQEVRRGSDPTRAARRR